MFAADLFFALALSGAGIESPAAASQTPPAAAPSDDQVVCKSIPVTGTRFAEQVCKTRGQWKADTAAAKEFVDKATQGFCTSGCKGH